METSPFILKCSEGEEMEAEEWHLMEAAFDRVDRSMEIVDRILNNFREAVLIAHSLMTRDLLPTAR